MEIEKIGIKIKFIEEKELKAIITLDFGDFLIKGFRVSDSQYENRRGDKRWLTPPTYKDRGGRYHAMFFIPNKELWEQLEDKIWDEYEKQYPEYYKKKFDIDI